MSLPSASLNLSSTNSSAAIKQIYEQSKTSKLLTNPQSQIKIKPPESQRNPQRLQLYQQPNNPNPSKIQENKIITKIPDQNWQKTIQETQTPNFEIKIQNSPDRNRQDFFSKSTTFVWESQKRGFFEERLVIYGYEQLIRWKGEKLVLFDTEIKKRKTEAYA